MYKFTVDAPSFSFTEKIIDEEQIEYIQEGYDEVKNLRIPLTDISEYNGSHPIYGVWETFIQSDNCPPCYFEENVNEITLIWENCMANNS